MVARKDGKTEAQQEICVLSCRAGTIPASKHPTHPQLENETHLAVAPISLSSGQMSLLSFWFHLASHQDSVLML